MPLIAVAGTVALMLCPQLGKPLPGAAQQAAQQPANSSSSGQQSAGAAQSTSTAKPCSNTSQQGSSSTANCQSTGKKAETKKHRKPVAPATTPNDTPTKTVVRNGSTSEPTVEISPEMSQQQATRQAQDTNQLLAATDANLKRISSRTLSASQQDTVQQIKNYMEQARAAQNDGDSQRAYNLANKAKLLSADLVGH